MAQPPAPLRSAALTLSKEDEAALTDLYVRGTPANTLRAYERDLIYIAAWKEAGFAAKPAWPESESVALRFILDHSRDLTRATPDDPARIVAEALIARGLRKSLACPATATLDRRIASWRAFHRMRNFASPFEAPLLRQARAKARRANARPRTPKSARPITRDLLLRLLDTCGPTLRDLRDRALLMTAWASGGRRRSEVTALRREDIALEDFGAKGLVWIRLPGTKTTDRATTPKLVLKGQSARVLVAWIDAAGITDGPLFRPVSRGQRALPRALNPEAVAQILRHRLALAGLPSDYASPHGLRSGFLTQAALDGAPIQAAMRLSLHRSVTQAQSYYDDVEIEENPATDLLD